MLGSLSQTKTKGIRESFDKRIVQVAIGIKYNLGLGIKNETQRRGKRTGRWTSQASKKKVSTASSNKQWDW